MINPQRWTDAMTRVPSMSVTVQAAHGHHLHFSSADTKAFVDSMARELAELGRFCHGQPIDFSKIEPHR
jgi:hypothetical protein